MVQPTDVKHIGARWVAWFLSRGIKVDAWDPRPQAKAYVRRYVSQAWSDAMLASSTSRPPLWPQPERPIRPVVLVEDNGPIHTSKLPRAALAARAHWLTLGWLPKYAPELNDIEVVWHDLKAYNLAHQTFADTDTPDRAIHEAVTDLNRERMPVPSANPRISASADNMTQGSIDLVGNVDRSCRNPP